MGNKRSKNQQDETNDVNNTQDNEAKQSDVTLNNTNNTTDLSTEQTENKLEDNSLCDIAIEKLISDKLQNCIKLKSSILNLTSFLQETGHLPSNDYLPLFRFPYKLFYQCSSNLIELDLSCWRPLPPPLDLSDTEDAYRNSLYSVEIPTDIINTFPSEIFNHLPNLTTLHLVRYPFPYLSDKISNLSKLQSLNTYGSQNICFPRTMYKLKQLSRFTPYTSYNLHYLPYEMKECLNISDSTMSTGALYNNRKNKMLFPPLPSYPVTYVEEIKQFIFTKDKLKKYVFGNANCCIKIDSLSDLIMEYAMNDSTFCSKCKCDILMDYIYYIWSFERIGTDPVGLLGRMCPKCIEKYIKEKDFIAYDMNDETNQTVLHNKKGVTMSVQTKYEYEQHEMDYYKIGSMRVSWKYCGFGGYNLQNIQKDWIKFWRYHLNIQFDEFRLVINKQTKEVNVSFI